MGYETLGSISNYIQWALVIAIGAITLRVAYIAYTYYITVEDVSFKSVILRRYWQKPWKDATSKHRPQVMFLQH